MNLPDAPSAFRSPTPPEQPWWWRTEDEEGNEVTVTGELAGERFASQSDAESWVGEVFGALAEQGSTRSCCSRGASGLRADVAAPLRVPRR
ncbi:hypothetical protein [Nocardioides zeae]